MSTFELSTLYTTLTHNLIKDKLIDLIERTFNRECSSNLASNERNASVTSEKSKKYHVWSCQNVCDVLTFLLDNILFDLAQTCTDKKLRFLGALIVLPWLPIYSCFVMRGTL